MMIKDNINIIEAFCGILFLIYDTDFIFIPLKQKVYY